MNDETHSLRNGDVLDGRFLILGVLGQGGMGTVYEATQVSVDRRVALKTIRADVQSQTLEQRFVQEAKIIAQITHPNVVQLYDYGFSENRGLLFLAMEYVEGVSLGSLVRTSALRLPLALEVIRQACSGLAEAHSRGVIHRDLKPENVMLTITAEGAVQVKVLDFGIALSVLAETRMTATGAITGTPHYMSPEQAQDQQIGEVSDVYALGVMLYEMLCACLPFRADTPLALLLKHVSETPQPISERVPDLPDSVALLVDAMLQKNPEDRPKSVRDLGHQIDLIKQELALPPVRVDVNKASAAAFEPWLSGRFSVLDEEVFGETLQSPVAATPLSSSQPMTAEAIVSEVTRPSAKPKRAIWLLLGLTLGLLVLVFSLQEPELEEREQPRDPPEIVQAIPVPVDATPKAREGLLAALNQGEEAAEVFAEGLEAAKIGAAKPPKVAKKLKPATKPKASISNPKPPIARATPPPTDVATLAMRRRTAGGTCSGEQTCTFEITELPGHVACLGKSTCKADCLIGGCQQYCFDESTCTFKCTGGGCKRMASEDARMTELD